MKHATFRFYGPLNALLPPERRQAPFAYAFWGTPSIKDAVEALGVPHTEVAYLQVNGDPVGFAYRLRADDRVSVYPRFARLTPDPERLLQPEPQGPPRFALDAHLGRLAKDLRVLGFDASYRNDYGDAALAALSGREGRVLLTRDRGLLKRNDVVQGYYVRAVRPGDQLDEVLRRFDLFPHFDPFTRCLQCNTPLTPVPRADVRDRLPPDVAKAFDTFFHCEACDKLYWRGSHVDAMRRRISARWARPRQPDAPAPHPPRVDIG